MRNSLHSAPGAIIGVAIIRVAIIIGTTVVVATYPRTLAVAHAVAHVFVARIAFRRRWGATDVDAIRPCQGAAPGADPRRKLTGYATASRSRSFLQGRKVKSHLAGRLLGVRGGNARGGVFYLGSPLFVPIGARGCFLLLCEF